MTYYRGDYYRGDPGLKEIFGGVVKVASGALKGFATGGPVGAIKGGVTTAAQVLSGKPSVPAIYTPTIATPTIIPSPTNYGFAMPPSVQVTSTTPGAVKEPGFGGMVSRILPGGETGYVLPTSGYHVSASGRIVKNRHMNPLNVRALRRAVRRESRFIQIAKRVVRGTGYTFKRTGMPGGRKKSRK